MNENLDLTKILKGCPEGTKFYSSVYGEVTFVEITNANHFPIKLKYYTIDKFALTTLVTKDGQIEYDCNGECTLFPSKDQRDWSKFVRFWDKKVERFDPKTWKSGDEGLFRLGETTPWRFGLFSHMFSDYFDQEVVFTTDGLYLICIPYNDDTKHLHNTTDDCPDYYKWWKEERFFEDL
mgnify:CR=1 FL=1